VTFSIVSWLAVYFVIWWTTLFAVLPFGVRSQTEQGEVVPGSDPGAPYGYRLMRTMAMTTLVATLVFLAVMWLLTQDLFGLDDIPFLPRFDPV
jgi:predicted secreted protein